MTEREGVRGNDGGGEGFGAVLGEIPAASAGMTVVGWRVWRGKGVVGCPANEVGGALRTLALRTGLGLGPKSSLGRRILGRGCGVVRAPPRLRGEIR